MITEAMKYFLAQARETLVKVGDRDYSTVGLNRVAEPECDTLTVHTLDGLVDYLGAEGINEGAQLINVVSHDRVDLFGYLTSKWRQREHFLRVEIPDRSKFKFGHFMSIEQAIIELRSRFVPTESLELVIREISSIAAGSVYTAEDDGVAQTVKTKVGIQRKGEKILNPIVRLRPFRTFSEVQQPESDFLLRLSGGGEKELPIVALFEADGAAWKIEAINLIHEYIDEQLKRKKIEDGVKVIS